MKRRILYLFFMVLAVSPFVAAQIITGTIQGVVIDTTGAVLPGVDITVRNLDTNQVRTSLTNETGDFLVPLLSVGTYEVTAELPGFQTSVKTGMQLQVEQRMNLTFTLEVGAITDTVTVTEAAPLVQSDTATVGTIIDAQKIVELPLNGRRFSRIGLLIPTATQNRAGAADGRDQRDMFSVAGLPARYNNYMIDGIENNDNAINMAAVKPSMDSVQEYKILAGTYSAEYGRGGGAQVNVVSKTGGNAFHGSIFEFYRDSSMDAKNYFAAPDEPNPPLTRHQFGFSLGGPIIRDKTFLFIADEVLRLKDTQTRVTQVPTAAMKQGDFSALLEPGHIFGGKPIIMRDPFNDNAPFPGNIIPADRFDRAGREIMKLFPDPNQAGKLNFLSASVDNWRWHQPSVRVDHTFSESDSLFFRWNHNILRTDNTFRGSQLPGWKYLSRMHTNNGGLVETHVFSPDLINEVRLGYNFFNEQYPSPNMGTDYTEELFGIKGASKRADELGYPRFALGGFTQIGDHNANPRVDHTLQFYDGISWLKGDHALKFGVNFKKVRSRIYTLSNPRGTFRFNGRFTGQSVGDALLGIPNQVNLNRGDAQVYLRQAVLHLFVQDDWQFSDRLTLNLGLRWEINQQPYDKDDERSNFNVATGKIEFAGVDGVPRGLSPTDFKTLAPRFGFAYDLTSDGRTIMRGGYGVYFNQVAWASFLTGAGRSAPWVEALEFISSATTPGITMDDPFPEALARGRITHYLQDVDLRTPYIQQFSFGLQREFGQNIVVDLSYLGNKASKQNIRRQVNQPTPGPGSRSVVNARRPFPEIGNLRRIETSGNMNYHSGSIRVEKRFSDGLTFNTSYTWGKAIHDQASPDSRNKRLGRGPANIDNRHRLVSSFVYELPSGGSGPARHIIGGWQISGVLQLRSGQAYTPGLRTDVSNTTVRADRPNVIGDTHASNPDPRAGWWDKAAFTMPELYTFGNAGTGVLTGPSFKNMDLSLQKVAQVTESQSLEFRLDFFNLTNHPNFGAPNVRFDSPSFGTISRALSARQLQLGVKYVF